MIGLTEVVAQQRLLSLTSALGSTAIYTTPGNNGQSLFRATVFLEQNSGSTGSVSATLTYNNNFSQTVSIPACTSTTDPSGAVAAIRINQGSNVSISTTIVSGSPNYNLWVALESISLP